MTLEVGGGWTEAVTEPIVLLFFIGWLAAVFAIFACLALFTPDRGRPSTVGT